MIESLEGQTDSLVSVSVCDITPQCQPQAKNIKHSVTWRRAMINDSDWTFIDPEARGGELFLSADAPFPSLKSSETKSACSVPTPAHYSTHSPEQKPKRVKTQDRLSETSLIYQSALALKVNCVTSSMFKSCYLVKSLPLFCGTQRISGHSFKYNDSEWGLGLSSLKKTR